MRIMSGMLLISAHSLETMLVCFLRRIYWSLRRAVVLPECSAPLRHRKIALSSLCSWGIKAAALLSQNQTPCCSDSASLRLISPGVSFHLLTRITRWQKVHVAESELLSDRSYPLLQTKKKKTSFKYRIAFREVFCLVCVFNFTWKIMIFNSPGLSENNKDTKSPLPLCRALKVCFALWPIAITLLAFSFEKVCQSADIKAFHCADGFTTFSVCGLICIHHPGMTQWLHKGQNDLSHHQVTGLGWGWLSF